MWMLKLLPQTHQFYSLFHDENFPLIVAQIHTYVIQDLM